MLLNTSLKCTKKLNERGEYQQGLRFLKRSVSNVSISSHGFTVPCHFLMPKGRGSHVIRVSHEKCDAMTGHR